MGLRIAEISTLARPVPPPGEGSVELLVSFITEGLVARGHDVTLFATADSRTTARLESPVQKGYRADSHMWDWQVYEAFQVREAFRRWREFDVIHCHSYHHALLFCEMVPIPVLMSIHIEPGPDYLFLARRATNCHLHFCSHYQARDFGAIAEKTIIPHGMIVPKIDTPAGGSHEDYLAFLGRFHPDKGVLEAIDIARKAGRRILLAAPENDYFKSHVRPHVDDDAVVYTGELHGADKFRFLAQSAAMLYPNRRGEPFGLVLIEALMAGTPVVAANVGAVSEIVDHGNTGWLAESEEDFVDGIEQVQALDRASIRAQAISRFSERTMVDELEHLILRLATGAPPHD